MRIVRDIIEIETHYHREIVDITDRVFELLRRFRIDEGIIILTSLSESIGLIVLEDRKNIIRGTGLLLDKIVRLYEEDDDLDMIAAKEIMKRILTASSITLSVFDYKPVMTPYQRVFALESLGPGPRRIHFSGLSYSAVDKAVVKLESGRELSGRDIL